MHRLSIVVVGLIPSICVAAPEPFPQFKLQEIDRSLKVGYGLRVVDLNADGKLDVVVADAARVVWFDQANDWTLRTIIENAKAGVKPDNVCLDVADVDGDGKLDVALGADWQPNNTSTGGSLQWLRQGKTLDQWTVHPISASIPTLHRIRFADVHGDAKPELVVAPLKGKGSTAAKNWSDAPAELTAYVIPESPAKDKWQPVVLDASMHVMHNFLPVGGPDAKPRAVAASYEGLSLVYGPGKPRVVIGGGNQDNPNGSRGSSEVKAGAGPGGSTFYAAVEPFHGHQVVAYTGNTSEEKVLTRTVIDEQLKSGHALWCADVDGDQVDEIVAGFRDPTERGLAPGVNVYRMTGDVKTPAWEKHVLDPKGMACEDLACADLNGDGKTDVVAVGRATGNVRIYWNEGMPAGK